MEGLEQINYTITEPQNTYRSDVYSPGQVKLQLEIGQEVNPERIRRGAMNIILTTDSSNPETKTIRIRTGSKNRTIEIFAVSLYDFKKSNGLIIDNLASQRTRNELTGNGYEEGYYRKGKIFRFDNCEGKITRLLPGRFELEIKGTFGVIFNYTAYNIPFNTN